MGNIPLIYMWIAFYDNRQVLPQFDFETGIENPYVSIDQTKLIKFGLFPINKDFSDKINNVAGRQIVESKNVPIHILKLDKNQRLIYVRRNYIRKFTFQICTKCGYQWQWMPNHKEGIGDAGLPIHTDYELQIWQSKTYPCAKCPKCGTINSIVCPDCKIIINEMKRKDSNEHYYECPKCKKEYPRYIRLLESGNNDIIYLLGYQITEDNKNFKYIMFIDNNGEIEISDNFNYR